MKKKDNFWFDLLKSFIVCMFAITIFRYSQDIIDLLSMDYWEMTFKVLFYLGAFWIIYFMLNMFGDIVP